MAMRFIFGRRLRAPKHIQASRIVPQLEALEDRTVPSTLTVTSAADDGSAGTLRAVIATASNGDTIRFEHHLAGQTITFQSELAITKSLDIDGLGADKLTISGNDTSRVFDISGSSAHVAIDDLTIADGRADNGGGILNAGGTLTLAHDVIADNQALGATGSGAKGGGVFNQGGTLTVEDSTFRDNLVWGGTGLVAGPNPAPGQGGGLAGYLGATTTVSDSTFRDNQAIGGDGAAGVNGSNGAGGGLWSDNGSTQRPVLCRSASAPLPSCALCAPGR
jgi:hypothetical protein